MPFSRLVASYKVSQQIRDLVRSKPEGVSSMEIMRRVLKKQMPNEREADALARAVIAEDRDIVQNAEGHWIVREGTDISGNLWDFSFVAFDIEATGTSPARHRLLEIGAVKYVNGVAIEEYSTLVNPGRRIPPYIQRMTGITSDLVSKAPRVQEIGQEFIDFIGDSILLAHNAIFDRRFLRAEFALANLPVFHNRTFCTLKISQKLFAHEVTRFGLDILCDHLGIEMSDQHRALVDADACGSLFLRITEVLAEEYGLQTVQQLRDFEKNGQFEGMAKPLPKSLKAIRSEAESQAAAAQQTQLDLEQ